MDTTKVEFFKHNINQADLENVLAVLNSPFLSMGKVVEEFENKFAEYLGVKYVVAVSSCTVALHLALMAMDVRSGDEVITTPMTFVATSNAILHTGAKPVFVDVDRETGLINLNNIYKALTTKTRVVLPVHLYGQMFNINSFKLNNIKILEDAAHCIEGVDLLDNQPGQKSDGACFSFYPTKSITSCEGGAIATNNKGLADIVRSMRNHGMTTGAHERYGKRYEHWDMERLGYNYRMSNAQAALLLGQLERINEFVDRRVMIWDLYERFLGDNPKITLIKTNDGSAKLMFTILVENRDEVLRKLQDKGVGVAVNYRAIHLLDYYRKRFGYEEGDFPNAEYIGNHTISLPLYPKLTNDEINYVIEVVKEAVG